MRDVALEGEPDVAPGKGSLAQRFAVRFGAVAALVVLDQWSKAAVFRLLDWESGDTRLKAVLGEWLALCTSCNLGAAFGQFHQFPYVLVLGRAVAVLFLGWLLLSARSRPRIPLVAMTLVLAGALGNLVDNLWAGCLPRGVTDHPFLGVRDFIDIDFEPLFGIVWHFPAFNVADSCITVGACIWILSGFLQRSEPSEKVEQRGQAA